MTKEEVEKSIFEANKKIDSILVRWFYDDPILLNVYTMVNRIPDPKQETIGISVISKVPTIKFNPNFVNTISNERLECVLVSEGFKILLRHCTTRLREPAKISGLASSITINQLLNSELKQVLNGINDITPDPLKFGLESNLCFEEYYRGIFDKSEEVYKALQKMFGTKDDKQQGENQQCKVPGSGDGESQEGSGKGQLEYKEFKNSDDAMKDYFDPSGTSNDEWGQNDIFDAELQNFIDGKKDSISKGWGKFTGNNMAQIIAASTPKISYKEILRNFQRSVIQKNTTSSRMKVNRRFDLEIPGFRKTYNSDIYLFCDESGSVDDASIGECLAVCNNIFKHCNLTFGSFDTEIKQIEKDYKKAKSNFVCKGRGGTNFQCVIDYIDKVKCDGVIIFTDGECCAPSQPKKAHLLWLMCSQNHQPPIIWPNRCKVAYLKRFEDNRSF